VLYHFLEKLTERGHNLCINENGQCSEFVQERAETMVYKRQSLQMQAISKKIDTEYA